MKRVAIIGAGISGLSIGQLLKESHDVTVFEKENTVGGLVRCRKYGNSIFHICGGHVFNTKRDDILDWFWSIMPHEEFSLIDRNSIIAFNSNIWIPYPIENHIYKLPQKIQKEIIEDFLHADSLCVPDNFDTFLHNSFGKTLYNLYFRPYNQKIWQQDLCQIPIDWLEGKLPSSTHSDIIFNNFNHIKEKTFVHSTFWYNQLGGSQRIVDILSKDLNIITDLNIESVSYDKGKWNINGTNYDIVVFCGNIKQLPSLLDGVDISNYFKQINELKFHGTTSVFCEIDANPYTWIYLPSEDYSCHRIICTGNLISQQKNKNRITATVEFTNQISLAEIKNNLSKVPMHPTYIDHSYNEYTYPVQTKESRSLIAGVKESLKSHGFYLLGRFAEWEYYNMDVAMGAAFDLHHRINKL